MPSGIASAGQLGRVRPVVDERDLRRGEGHDLHVRSSRNTTLKLWKSRPAAPMMSTRFIVPHSLPSVVPAAAPTCGGARPPNRFSHSIASERVTPFPIAGRRGASSSVTTPIRSSSAACWRSISARSRQRIQHVDGHASHQQQEAPCDRLLARAHHGPERVPEPQQRDDRVTAPATVRRTGRARGSSGPGATAAANAYGTSVVSVASRMTFQNWSTRLLLELDHISPLTSTEETTNPNTGVRLLPFTTPNRLGNNPSCAAASGMRPWIRIQPFRAPNVEISATSATSFSHVNPRKLPVPNISRAASANGRVRPGQLRHGDHAHDGDRRQHVDRRRRERAEDRRSRDRPFGSRTSSAGTVADSRPMKAQSVSAAAAVMPPIIPSPVPSRSRRTA